MVSVNTQLARLIALYGSAEKCKRITDATAAVFRSLPPDVSKEPAVMFGPAANENTSFGFNDEGFILWINSITGLLPAAGDDKHKEHAEALAAVQFFRRFALTLDYRAMLDG